MRVVTSSNYGAKLQSPAPMHMRIFSQPTRAKMFFFHIVGIKPPDHSVNSSHVTMPLNKKAELNLKPD